MRMLKDSQGSAENQVSTQISHEQQSDQQNNTLEAPIVDSGSVSISSNKSRRVTREDIEVVQNLIERCLQLYMNRNEVVNTLLCRARIEPSFTTLVWQKLEEENAEFFKAYYIRLKLKQQILLFNDLLEKQYQLMNHSASPKVPLTPMQNGINHMPVNNLPPTGYPILQQSPIPSTGQPHIHSVGSMPSCHVVHGIPAPGNFHPLHINSGNNMMLDRSTADTVPVIPTCAIKSEEPSSPALVASNGQFRFTPSEMSGVNMEASALDYTYKSHMVSSDELQLGPDGWNGQPKESLQSSARIPWNSSLTDLSAHWPNLQDLGPLGNYSGSPYLADSDMLLDSPEQKDIVEDFFADTVPGAGSQSEEEKP